jgi:hypothetical protein
MAYMTKTGGEFKWIVAFVKGDIPNADASKQKNTI